MDYRTDRMQDLIVETFINCLEQEDFSTLTVGQLAKEARISRSTFYRYFEDKYLLRDFVVDDIVQNFVSNLEVDFLDEDIRKSKKHTDILRSSLERVFSRRRELEILWSQKLLGRNVFEEMIDSGAEKIETAILSHDNIPAARKKYADWYAKLLANNMLVTIRWWFSHSEEVTSEQVTAMMKQHMMCGTIPTLKSENGISEESV